MALTAQADWSTGAALTRTSLRRSWATGAAFSANKQAPLPGHRTPSNFLTQEQHDPQKTLSPTLIETDLTVPDLGAGDFHRCFNQFSRNDNWNRPLQLYHQQKTATSITSNAFCAADIRNIKPFQHHQLQVLLSTGAASIWLWRFCGFSKQGALDSANKPLKYQHLPKTVSPIFN